MQHTFKVFFPCFSCGPRLEGVLVLAMVMVICVCRHSGMERYWQLQLMRVAVVVWGRDVVIKCIHQVWTNRGDNHGAATLTAEHKTGEHNSGVVTTVAEWDGQQKIEEG